MIVISDFEINQVASPNLPLAPIEYERQYADQLNNVLRLYFNRVDAILDQLKTVCNRCTSSNIWGNSGGWRGSGCTYIF